jgi:hypothetical protein
MTWALSDESGFMPVYDAWKESGYARRLSPSLDRIDNEQGYVLGNMRFVTSYENWTDGLAVAHRNRAALKAVAA